jgi:hypothetical protein
MKRPHPVAGMFVATLVLWLLSIGCAVITVVTFRIDPTAGYTGQVPLPAVLGAAAALGSGLFALWTGWRACRALDYLVVTAR